MYCKLKSLLLILASICFTFSSAHANESSDYEWVGGLFGGNVVYTVHQLRPNKYFMETTTVNGVSPEKLLAAFRARGAKLCMPKTARIMYRMSTETYMGTFNATMRLPMKAPKIVGTIICE